MFCKRKNTLRDSQDFMKKEKKKGRKEKERKNSNKKKALRDTSPCGDLLILTLFQIISCSFYYC